MTRKRSILFTAMSVVCLLTVLTLQVRAQNPLEDAIKQLTSDNAKGYLQPFVTAFGANMNSGVYHSANISQLGFTLRLDLIAMGTLIGDAEKKYNATNPYDGSEIATATVFGERGTVVIRPPDSLVQYQFQNGQVKTSIVPFFMPQLTIGDLYGTQAIIRYVPIPEVNNVPKVTLFGIGARHCVSQYIPAVPVDLSASIFYQSLEVGNLFEAKTLSFGAQVSKSFAILTVYGGLQYESMSMDVNYTYTGNIPGIAVTDANVSLNLDGKNKFRGTAGLDLSLALLHIFADINVGSAIVVSGGVGFGF